jgi:hypothetical protein
LTFLQVDFHFARFSVSLYGLVWADGMADAALAAEILVDAYCGDACFAHPAFLQRCHGSEILRRDSERYITFGAFSVVCNMVFG